jgi:hypothetical protein
MRPIAKEVASEFLLTSTKGWLGLSLSSHIARVMPAFVFFLIAIGVACAGQNNALVSLISRARVALGPGFGQVHALHVTGKMRTAVASGTFEWWADLTTGEFAVSKSAGPLTHFYGYDGHVIWRKDSKGIVLVQNGPAAVTWNANSEFEEKYALFSPNHGGAEVTYLGVRRSQGKSYEVISVVPPHGYRKEWWFETATGLLARRIIRWHGRTITYTFFNYQAAHGLMIARREIMADDTGPHETFEKTQLEADVPDLEHHLRRPVTGANDFLLPGNKTSIPIDTIDNHIGLDVRLNGKGPFHLWFDTGGYNIVDPAVAREIGAEPAGIVPRRRPGKRADGVRFVRIDKLSIGAATLFAQPFLITDLGPRALHFKSKQKQQGMIGYELPARFLVTIDYEARRMVLRIPNGRATASTDSAIPLLFDGSIPAIPCRLAGINTTCVLDTGSSGLCARAIGAPRHLSPSNASTGGGNLKSIGRNHH